MFTQLETMHNLATDEARRNSFFTRRGAYYNRGAAFGAQVWQSTWNNLHHPELKWLFDIYLKHGFFDWIDANLDFSKDGHFPGQVLRSR